MLWACILLPQLALDGVLRGRAQTGPLVLVDGAFHARTLVAVNAAARAAGLRIGQRLLAAQALLSRFDALPYDHQAVERWQRFLATVAYRYSSEVALLPHAIVLEVSRSLALFGPWPRLESQLRHAFGALGFRHRITVAPTPQAAYVLAGVEDGRAVLVPDELRQALQGIALRKSRLPVAGVDMLAGTGIRTLGQLLHLPRDGLRRRLGGEFLQALDQLLGDRPDELENYRPPDVFDQRLELTHEVENVTALVFPLRRMVGDLAAYLATRDGGVQRFVLHLEHRDGEDTTMPVGLLAPERDASMLFELARGRLERIALPAPVLVMRLIARDLPAFVPCGRDLFDTQPAHALPFEQLRERLRARLGDQAVYQLSSTTDPRPERAQTSAPGAVAYQEPHPRPTWLLDRPIPLRGAVPRILAGPERLETGWWDGAHACRDYYVVETALGQHAWVFCEPGERHGWMLHGWFA